MFSILEDWISIQDIKIKIPEEIRNYGIYSVICRCFDIKVLKNRVYFKSDNYNTEKSVSILDINKLGKSTTQEYELYIDYKMDNIIGSLIQIPVKTTCVHGIAKYYIYSDFKITDEYILKNNSKYSNDIIQSILQFIPKCNKSTQVFTAHSLIPPLFLRSLK